MAQLVPVTDDLVVAPLESLVTFEGEHAALVRVTGRRKQSTGVIEYLFGFVFGDDFYTGFVAYCTDEAQLKGFRISLRAFLLEYELRLGARRTRRFNYQPPVNWQARERGLRATWYPLEFPRHGSRIVVTPAAPTEATFSAIEGQLKHVLAARGIVPTRHAPKARINTEHGLRGWQWQFGTATQEIVAATLLDDRFGYHLRLETTPDRVEADREIFRRVVASVQPVPAPTAGQNDALLRAMTPA